MTWSERLPDGGVRGIAERMTVEPIDLGDPSMTGLQIEQDLSIRITFRGRGVVVRNLTPAEARALAALLLRLAAFHEAAGDRALDELDRLVAGPSAGSA